MGLQTVHLSLERNCSIPLFQETVLSPSSSEGLCERLRVTSLFLVPESVVKKSTNENCESQFAIWAIPKHPNDGSAEALTPSHLQRQWRLPHVPIPPPIRAHLKGHQSFTRVGGPIRKLGAVPEVDIQAGLVAHRYGTFRDCTG